MNLTIIITHHKTPELLRLCLNSIFSNLGKTKFEVLIADSQTNDEMKEDFLDEFPRIQFLGSKDNLGYAKIVNKAVLHASGEYILVLNADIIVKKGAVEYMLGFMKKNKNVGVAGPQLINFDGSIQCSRFKFYTPTIAILRRTAVGKTPWGKKKVEDFLMKDKSISINDNEPYEADWLMGSAIMLRASTFEKVGLFDERFFMYFEDVDLCTRIKAVGLKIFYLPAAKMYHYHIRISYKKGGLGDLVANRYARIHVISALKYFWKHNFLRH